MKLLVVVVDPKQDTTHPPRKKILFFLSFSDQFIPIHTNRFNPIRLIDKHIHSFYQPQFTQSSKVIYILFGQMEN